jgi:hypothetical protein
MGTEAARPNFSLSIAEHQLLTESYMAYIKMISEAPRSKGKCREDFNGPSQGPTVLRGCNTKSRMQKKKDRISLLVTPCTYMSCAT